MCAKKRTLKPEQCSQNPRVQREAELSKNTKSKAVYKVLLGDDPGGRLGRTVITVQEVLTEGIKSFSPIHIEKTSVPTKTSKTTQKIHRQTNPHHQT